MEKWKPVAGFEDYEVSDLGRVRRTKYIHCHPVKGVLKPWFGTGGYLQLSLSKDGKKHYAAVHRLVALAFIPNPLGFPEVNHIGPKSDCRAIKLEWSTKRSNSIHAVRTGRTPGDGISFIKQTGRWRVRFNPEPCVREHVGTYATFEEAKAARDEKIRTLK